MGVFVRIRAATFGTGARGGGASAPRRGSHMRAPGACAGGVY
jgi:hypothetical protein